MPPSESKLRPIGVGVALRGSTLRRCSTTKDTNDTNPTYATLTQAVAPDPKGRQTIAQRVSAGVRLRDEPQAPEHKADKPQSLEAAKSSVIAVLESSCFPRFEITPVQLHRRRLRRTTSPRPRPSSRLCVRPFRLNHRRMAARIARRRKRALFPSDETALLEHSPWHAGAPNSKTCRQNAKRRYDSAAPN